ncbi:hypothetical protein OS493_034294 [Desmophyllum pertusum]|uniref:Fibrinogen C-terminal domain-containing protein n=1 Tax=Desmophyllum pertusum TaxID=174260 RepID=A0A9W9YWM6_9CNID|nr:hypothetical protein OS493_034294 [Desmophyllum pertusum]
MLEHIWRPMCMVDHTTKQQGYIHLNACAGGHETNQFNMGGNSHDFAGKQQNECYVYAENPDGKERFYGHLYQGSRARTSKDSGDFDTSGTYWMRLKGSRVSFQGYCDMSAVGQWKRVTQSWIDNTLKGGVTLTYSEENNGLVISVNNESTTGLYAFNASQGDTIANEYYMGGNSHAFDGKTTKCNNNAETNFWYSTSPSVRYATVVLRRQLAAEKAGIYTGTSCGTPTYKIKDIYVYF